MFEFYAAIRVEEIECLLDLLLLLFGELFLLALASSPNASESHGYFLLSVKNTAMKCPGFLVGHI